MAMQYVEQVPGMPMVGLGLWKAGAGEVSDVVYEAIKIGYRHLDGASNYGNEKEVGLGIKRALDEGICKREDLFIASKLWNTYHRREHVPLALQKTLDDLGLEYLDMYLVHFPVALKFVPFEERYPPEWTDAPENSGKMHLDRVPFRETWEAMEQLKASGKAKHIGVSNTTCSLLMDVLTYCTQKPEMNQVELHVYLQQPNLVEFCHENGIAVTAYSPLGGRGYMAMGPMFATKADDCFEDPVLMDIAKAHGKTVPNIMLRWNLQRGVAVIPMATTADLLRENLNMFDFDLSQKEMARIARLDRNRRFNDPRKFTVGWDMPVGYPLFG